MANAYHASHLYHKQNNSTKTSERRGEKEININQRNTRTQTNSQRNSGGGKYWIN